MTSELSDSLLRFVIAGCFTQDYILPVSGLTAGQCPGREFSLCRSRITPVGENSRSDRPIG